MDQDDDVQVVGPIENYYRPGALMHAAEIADAAARRDRITRILQEWEADPEWPKTYIFPGGGQRPMYSMVEYACVMKILTTSERLLNLSVTNGRLYTVDTYYLYYAHKLIFQNMTNLKTHLRTALELTDCTHIYDLCLLVLQSTRLVVGPVSFDRSFLVDRVDCMRFYDLDLADRTAERVPCEGDARVISASRFSPLRVIVIEHEVFFWPVVMWIRAHTEERYHWLRRLVFICTKGYPDTSTYEFLRRIMFTFPMIDGYLLFDLDTNGYEAALTTMFGTWNARRDALAEKRKHDVSATITWSEMRTPNIERRGLTVQQIERRVNLTFNGNVISSSLWDLRVESGNAHDEKSLLHLEAMLRREMVDEEKDDAGDEKMTRYIKRDLERFAALDERRTFSIECLEELGEHGMMEFLMHEWSLGILFPTDDEQLIALQIGQNGDFHGYLPSVN